MRNINVKEVTQWVIDNRKGDAFLDYTHNKIANEIAASVKCGCFRLETDHNDNIIGVVCGEKFEDAKCILIHDVLTTHPDALKRFWQRYLMTYPDYSLLAGHRGKMKTIYKAKQKV